MRTFRLTPSGIREIVEAKRIGTLQGDKPIPTKIRRENVKQALIYYWGRGIPLDPSHLTWTLNPERAN